MATNQDIINKLNAQIMQSLNTGDPVDREVVEKAPEPVKAESSERIEKEKTDSIAKQKKEAAVSLPYSSERNEKVNEMQRSLPGFKLYAEHLHTQIAKQEDKLDKVNRHIANANDKLEKLQSKLEASQYKADFFRYLQTTNTMPGINAVLNALAANEVRKASPLTKKINLQKEYVAQLHEKADKVKTKLEKKRLNYQAVNAVSNFVRNFANRNTDERREAYIDCLTALNQASLSKKQNKLERTEAKIARCKEMLDNSKLTNVEKLKINKTIEKLSLKAQSISFSIEQYSGVDQDIKEVSKEPEKLDDIIDDSIDYAFDVVTEHDPEEITAIADDLSGHSIDNLRKYADKSLEKLTDISLSDKDKDKSKIKSKEKESLHDKIEKMQKQIKEAVKDQEGEKEKAVEDKSL